MIRNKSFGASRSLITVSDTPIFGIDKIENEIQMLNRKATIHKWKSPTGEVLELVIPPTVYPPREDTDLMAKAIMKLGPGKNRNCLEIGCGSGVLSMFSSRQGWNVTACDINPFAVASTRGVAEDNQVDLEVHEGGPSPQIDGELLQWTGGKSFDLLFWNLPYLRYDKTQPETLGPMEEAALLDTDNSGLIEHALNLINRGLLNDSGIALFIISNNETGLNAKSKCYSKGLAVRTISKLDLDDGEQLQVIAVWKPYVNSDKIVIPVIDSTNLKLLESDLKVGSSICSPKQISGHGRRGRAWINSKRSFAGSWKLFDTKSSQEPGILQIIAGLCVKEAISSSIFGFNNNDVIIKWPNDVMIKFDDKWKKVCGILVESRTVGKSSTIVVGIGINFSGDENEYQFPIGFLENYSKVFTFDKTRNLLDAILSSYFENNEKIIGTNKDDLKQLLFTEIKLSFNSLGIPLYRNKRVELSKLCQDGKIEVIDEEMNSYIVDDGESIIWDSVN